MTKPKRVQIEVAPDGPLGWSLTIDGEHVAAFLRQKNAENAGRKIGQAVKVGRAELVIKNRDGEIAQKDSYGSDPRRTRG